jgi:hypothetical protein
LQVKIKAFKNHINGKYLILSVIIPRDRDINGIKNIDISPSIQRGEGKGAQCLTKKSYGEDDFSLRSFEGYVVIEYLIIVYVDLFFFWYLTVM